MCIQPPLSKHSIISNLIHPDPINLFIFFIIPKIKYYTTNLHRRIRYYSSDVAFILLQKKKTFEVSRAHRRFVFSLLGICEFQVYFEDSFLGLLSSALNYTKWVDFVLPEVFCRLFAELLFRKRFVF